LESTSIHGTNSVAAEEYVTHQLSGLRDFFSRKITYSLISVVKQCLKLYFVRLAALGRPCEGVVVEVHDEIFNF